MVSGTLNYSRPGFGSHLRALGAIARKDWHYYWRYPLNAVSTVVQPIAWLTPVYFLGQAFSVNGKALGFSGYSGTTDYMSFILIGSVIAAFINTVFWGMGYSLKEDMDTGVLEPNWLAPASRPLLLVGRTLTSLLITTITAFSTLAIAALLFGFQVDGNVLSALAIAVPMLLGLYGFGFAFAALILVLREANTMVDVSSFLVTTFSGTQFPVTALPGFLLPIALALPLTYGLDAIRGLLLTTTTLLPIWAEVGLMVLFMVLMTALGLWVFTRLERWVRRRGTLSQH
jgi:ABC-2 type transport system permease protein